MNANTKILQRLELYPIFIFVLYLKIIASRGYDALKCTGSLHVFLILVLTYLFTYLTVSS